MAPPPPPPPPLELELPELLELDEPLPIPAGVVVCAYRTAPAVSSRPAPQPPRVAQKVPLGCARAVCCSPARICAFDSCDCTLSISAIVPATSGVEKLVPATDLTTELPRLYCPSFESAWITDTGPVQPLLVACELAQPPPGALSATWEPTLA